MNRLITRLAVASTLAALLALATSSGPASAARIPNCAVAQNVEGIIDDSGSMGSDSKFAARIIEILAGIPQNQSKTMGAVEFGTSASALFPPLVIGPNRPTIINSLALLDADGSTSAGDFGGSTNYSAGFALANSQNPTAAARIFLSDGGHNVGTYDPANHTNPNIKTYAVGLGAFDTSIMGQIAAQTGGELFLVENADDLQRVAGIVNARLNCRQDPITFVDEFIRQGQAFGHGFKATSKSATLLTSWSSEEAAFGVIKVIQILKGKAVGKSSIDLASAAARKKRGVKVKRTSGATFTQVQLKKLKKGAKVKFKVKARSLPFPTTGVTQVTR